MTKLPDEHQKLVEFLRQHHPVPPAADASLEAGILFQARAIASTPSPNFRQRHPWFLKPFVSKVSAGLAASMLIVWAGYQVLVSPEITAENANIEAFLENNWNSTATDNADNDWLAIAELTSN